MVLLLSRPSKKKTSWVAMMLLLENFILMKKKVVWLYRCCDVDVFVCLFDETRGEEGNEKRANERKE